ncbi:MAG: recombinase RecA, partial [Synechococcaceae cyanobacterium RL_1_2]|nr:recombinase RecA [Synechococcaceae cyanobacterium RL_1_2]
LKEKEITTLFTSEYSKESPDGDVQFLCDGIITIAFKAERTIEVSKFRGSNFHKGVHAVNLTDRGMEIFPKLIPRNNDEELHASNLKPMSSGVPEIDMLLEGGIEPTTVSVITGPSGVGKTTLGMQFIKEAAGRGDRSVVYVFEEALSTLLRRCESVNIPVMAMIDRGTLKIIKMEPLATTAEEFANRVRDDIETNGTKIVMLDSISGYRLCFKEGDLVRNMHNLAQYLRSMKVTTIITNEIETITGDFKATESGISYLADNLLFLRYLEIQGTISKAIGVLKKRLSGFENTMREFSITRYGIRVGEPLTNLRRILSGTPEFFDDHRNK